MQNANEAPATRRPIRDSELVKPEVINQTAAYFEELGGIRMDQPKIVTQADSERITEEVRDKKALKSKMEKFYEPFAGEAFRAHRATTAHRDAVVDPLKKSIEVDERALGAWLRAEDQKRRDEQARLQVELNKQFDKQVDRRASQLEKAGRPDEAQDLRTAAENNRPAVSVPPVETPKGVVGPKPEFDFEIVNPDLVPRSWCSPDERKIRDTVKALGKSAEIAGVRIFPKEAKATVRG